MMTLLWFRMLNETKYYAKGYIYHVLPLTSMKFNRSRKFNCLYRIINKKALNFS
jgi:hypothetical protein